METPRQKIQQLVLIWCLSQAKVRKKPVYKQLSVFLTWNKVTSPLHLNSID